LKILVVGSGGREHALLWRLARDAPGAELRVAGGNGGTAALAARVPVAADDLEGLAAWSTEHRVDLTVVGPEGPLAAGIVDRFAARGLPIFGPNAAAAEIESSKAFAKDLMKRHRIPTAEFETFSDLASAEAFIRRRGGPLVVKASGLAAGKGAMVCETTEQALEAARSMLGSHAFGDAGDQIVVEEFMTGEELSVFALSDGSEVRTLIPAQDHKRIGEGDTGPNTGGMGAYAPVSIATPALLEEITRDVLLPTVAAMAGEGRPYRGLLYAGLMITPDGPRVVEFNCRFGDPETQAVLPLLEGSLLEPMLAIARGESLAGSPPLRTRSGAAVTTVVAAEGYPGPYGRGMPITIDPEVAGAEDVLVFHAGTSLLEGKLVTSGGRVAAVTGLGRDVSEAAERSRWGAERVGFEGRYFRRDIGWREASRA
jgi:phosphoribosylamine--glycine ligase